MNNKKYNHTEKECSVLWNIAIECAVKGFNNELSDKNFLKQVDRFRNKLNTLIKNKISENSNKRYIDKEEIQQII